MLIFFRHSRSLQWGLLVAMGLILGGCIEWGYYRQAVSGHWDLLSKRQSIDRVMADPATPEDLRARLELVLDIRDFAGRELLLPDNRSYRSYADLGRPFAVWNLVATPELSLDPLTWCFPVAGCVPYRGYFDQDAARQFAAGLKADGYDVQVYGVAAYSTLNWFDDPVLNTFIHYQEAELAGLIFHELAHQQLYVKNDGTFNESFARTVELVGVERWMQARGQAEPLALYQSRRKRHQQFIDLLLSTRRQLQSIYRGSAPEAQQLLAKNDIIEQFRLDYQDLKQQWQGDSRFDRWVDRPLNNAHFAQVATYHQDVPALRLLLQQHNHDLRQFYAAAAELARQPAGQRRQKLDAMAGKAQGE